MTISQEDALYDFLENVTEPFSLDDVVTYIRMADPKRTSRLALEVASFIDARNIAFRLGTKRWVSRRGCFEKAPFVISPSRLELLNGILIPGHRCVPFANPMLLPHELGFFWEGQPVPVSTTEGPPEDFYPYYNIFGEEYAPQYVARDNPENEAAFNADPYEDPPEVSIHTLDMRNIYRETGFVPGDRFVVRAIDWKAGTFSLERVGRDDWAAADLYAWFEAAEGGFEESFSRLGAGASTEEQIAYAYWYGGGRIREVPAYSLEDFLYEKTDRIETVAYGIETRFWYAGKEIPDTLALAGSQIRPDKTMIEEILYRAHIPVSEYVVQSYVRDALFRNDRDIAGVLQRLVPPAIKLEDRDGEILANYALDILEEFRESYSVFADKSMGPIRQRVGELHTAVVELAARLSKGGLDPSWLPKHTFIVLSQIQSHAAGVMEDLDTGEAPPEGDLETMDNSLDSMIETYEDIKRLIDEALDSFRRNKLSVVKNNIAGGATGRLAQVSISGTNVWRRIIVPESFSLESLHGVVQALFGWENTQPHKFIVEQSGGAGKERAGETRAGKKKGEAGSIPGILSFQRPAGSGNRPPGPETLVGKLGEQGVAELLYEYGAKWTVKIILLSRYEGETEERARCVAGAGAAPPEQVEGPLRFRKILQALERGNEAERRGAQRELGQDFDPGFFDLGACNRRLNTGTGGASKKLKTGPVILDF